MGTPAFMDFVESIQSEGVTFEYKPMGAGAKREESLIVEVDTQNEQKDLDALDIAIPKLTRRYNREFKNLDALDPGSFKNQLLPLKPFTPEQTREIVFKTMLDSEIHHTIQTRWLRAGRLSFSRCILRAAIAQGPAACRWL